MLGRRRRIAYVLLIFALIGFHLRLSIYADSGSILVPNYLILTPAAILFAMQANNLTRLVGNILIALTVFIVTQPLLSVAPGADVVQGLRSAAQLMAAIMAAAAIVYTAAHLSAKSLRKIFLTFWCGLMSLATLELLGFRNVMLAITQSLYAGTNRGVYGAVVSNDTRDSLLYGRPRPTAFASEPSFLAESWMVMAALVFLLDKNRGSVGSWIRLIVMFSIGYALAPSNLVYFILLATLIWHFWPRGKFARVHMLFYALLGCALFITPVLGTALENVDSSSTASFFARVASGPHVGFSALGASPIFGYGIGNTAGAAPIVIDVWQSSGSFGKWPWYIGAPTETMMANGFWWQWISLGLVGGIVFTLLALRLLERLGVRNPWCVMICTWTVWYAGGIFVSPVDWMVFALFAVPFVAQRSSAKWPLGSVDGHADISSPSEATDAVSLSN